MDCPKSPCPHMAIAQHGHVVMGSSALLFSNFQLRRRRVNGRITSLQTQYNGLIYIGTDDCEIYTLDYATFQLKLQITCNSCHVYDIAFPK